MAKIYKTKQGDTWDLISFNVFGSELFSKEIINANKDKSHIMIFSANTKINIPSVDLDVIDDSILPPWRKNRNVETT